jgi:hypothetical protein
MENRGLWVGVVVAVLLAGAGAWWWSTRTPPVVPAPVAVAPSPTTPPPPPRAVLGPESDLSLPSVASRLSTRPEWAQWFSGHDLIRVFVAAVNSVADGRSPRSSVSFLAPEGKFQTTAKDGRVFIDPKSFARYDVIADVVGSVDMKAAAAELRSPTLQPLFDAAYAEIGKPGTTFAERLNAALARLLAVHVPEGPVEVKEGVVYRLADPALQNESDAAKHLLRMGPRNATLIQRKLRELQEALKTPPSP